MSIFENAAFVRLLRTRTSTSFTATENVKFCLDFFRGGGYDRRKFLYGYRALLQNRYIVCYSIDLTRYTGQKGANEMATIAVDDSENLEKAIKRFKRMVEKEGIIREYKKREFYEKPSTILNRKNKALQRKLMKKTHPRHESKAY